MRIFINLPTWLGDSVMASAAIYALKEHFKEAYFLFYGSFASTELFKKFENSSVFIENKKERFSKLIKSRKDFGEFDYALSFRSALSSKIILKLIKAKQRFFFDKYKVKDEHQVLKYLYFIENSFGFKASSQKLKLPIPPRTSKTKILGLNPGAHYGSAKRWEASYFAEVAKVFTNTHKILIFGLGKEKELCDEIEQILKKEGVKAKNLCDKTSIYSLCKNISMCNLFITNDSGPMHIATAYGVKTLAIFGPTRFTQTAPWQNPNAKIMRLDLPCSPCMQRTCPLKHHQCMKDLKPEIIIKEAKKLLNI